MQLVTMTFRKVTYDLGFICPLFVDGKVSYVIIPNFDFRPPFMLYRMERCYLRLEMLAKEHLAKGGNIPKLLRPKPTTIPVQHHIEAKDFQTFLSDH